ncbi:MULTISPECIES: XdhC family protein [unclassified Polaromonas]|uniref:XdhC family protein n=1 Tax=unclassified Polaromonas TaxID=2638319 RepID=UPI0018CAAFE4|nr:MULTISPECIES: XdhC family protein [unclassified Polaromonas]MBG6071218.1 xanthine dehydrogenase accessory factor [Polaromonas sp. CG_9.7]MBG6113218.1 xanthine dehydrogenase accessory factor [Polaromonas sp. CG_9.2]MDH6185750.1 xanthine dehydrogenase accessory factor [Polaromonas sp. CG_23.6]
MESLDLRVLAEALDWHRAGWPVTLVTVVQTWGSAPRPPGALLAVRGDGAVSGSVSGGCVEDDLIARIRSGEGAHSDFNRKPSMMAYGVSREEAARFGLPCGGTLRLVQESLEVTAWVEDVLQRTARHQLVARTLTLATGEVTLSDAARGAGLQFDGLTLTTVFGPRWRLLLIGAGQLSQAVASIALMLDFEVLVCDPRDAYLVTQDLPGVTRLPGMPDDVVRELLPDAHTAIVALTHDPKLDDMALLEALTSDAFYVGALGSARNQATRKQRLAEHFELSALELDRLHGPVGLRIGARTPAEIAVSVMAQIIEVKNAQPLVARPVSAAAVQG